MLESIVQLWCCPGRSCANAIVAILKELRMLIVAVFHDEKVSVGTDYPDEIRANPTMSVTGMGNILKRVSKIAAEGAFDAFYCSRVARALDTASVIALELDLDFKTMRELGQFANKDGDDVVFYPGHDEDNCVSWQQDGLNAFGQIAAMHEHDARVIVVSHRPILGGIVAHIRRIRDEVGIKAVVNEPTLVEDGYIVFEVTDGGIEIVG